MKKETDFEIIVIEIKHHMDYDDYGMSKDIGKFTNTWESGAIVRSDRAQREYPMKYFVSENNVWKDWEASWSHCTDEEKAITIKKYGSLKAAVFHYAKEDMKRLENLGRTWNYIGVTCLASIRITLGEHTFTVQVYDSLYGVESDSKEGIIEVEKDLMANVQFELMNIGFTLIEVEQAFREIKRTEDYS